MKQVYFFITLFLIAQLSISQNSLVFDGDINNGDRVIIEPHEELDFTDGTIEVLFKADEVSGNRTLIANRNSANDDDSRWSFHVNQATDKIYIWAGRVGGTGQVAIFDATITPDVWYHIAFVVSTTTGCEVFLDGTSLGTTAVNINAGVTGENVYIGAVPDRADQCFSGAIDEVRIWNVKRNQADIQADITTELDGDETGLVAYYTFTEIGSSSSVSDSCTNDYVEDPVEADVFHDGVLTNFEDPEESWSDEDGVEAILSVDDVNSDFVGYSLYPNPATDYIRVASDLELVNYKIYNTLGFEILNGQLNAQNTIEIQNLPSGNYILKFENRLGVAFIKK